MDAKAEGKNLCRHVDITTSNHASYPGSTPPYPEMETMSALALDRIANKQCPCCGKDTCVSAFKEGEKAQSMEEFYGIGAPTEEGAARMKLYKQTLGLKEKACTCQGRVFPKAPCDVFRSPERERTIAIERQWGYSSTDFKTYFVTTYPSAIADFCAANPTQLPPSTGERFHKVDHLTPKSGGGCPDNPGNLQPHDTLCITCKTIDDMFGEWQKSNPNWSTWWHDAFLKLKVKRFRVDGFTPGWW